MIKNISIAAIMILSYCNLSYSQPILDIKTFANGNVKTFNSKGHPKAKGLEFSIKYPDNWKIQEANRPNIVQKFLTNYDKLIIEYSVLVKKLDYTPTQKEKNEMYNNMEEMKPSGAKFLAKNNKLIIDGEKAGSIEYQYFRNADQNIGNYNVSVSSIIYIIFYKDYMIQISGAVINSTNHPDEALYFKQYKLLFQVVAGSFVLDDKWK
jgi:hypothetical protein